MKKFILALLFGLGFVGVSQAAALMHTHVTSSGQITNQGTALYQVNCGSQSQVTNYGTAFVQFFDTAAYQPAGGTSLVAFRASSNTTATPPLIFVSTTVSVGDVVQAIEEPNSVFSFPMGIYFNNGIFIHIAQSMGNAWGGCTVYWRREEY